MLRTFSYWHLSPHAWALWNSQLCRPVCRVFLVRNQEFVGRRAGLSFAVEAVSPIIGGALVGLIGAVPTLAGCAVGYLLYSGVMGLVPPLNAPVKTSTSSWRDLLDALRWTKASIAVRTLFIYWLFSLAAVPLGVMTAVPYITSNLGKGSFAYGLASACYGAASVVSSVIAGKMKFPGGVRWWLVGTGLVYGCVNMVMLANPGYLLFCLLWVLWGVAYGPEEVATQIVFVRIVPPNMQGRLFSLMNVMMTFASFIGYSAVGSLSDHLGPTVTMGIAGLVFIGATLYGFVFSKGARAIGEVKLAG